MTRARRSSVRFPPALLAPVVVATLAAMSVPKFPPAAAVVVGVAVLLRLLVLRRGREVESPRAWTVLWTSGPAIATAYVSAVARTGGDAGPALLAAGAVAVAVGVVAPSTPAGWARLLGLAGILVAGSCLASPRAPAVVGALAFVVALVPAALAFGDTSIGSRVAAAGGEGLVRRVNAPRVGATSWRVRGAAALVLLAAGLPVGFLFFWALPSKPASKGAAGRDGATRGQPGPVDDEFAGRSRDDGGDPPFMGPSAGERSGLQQNLKLNNFIVLTVRVGDGEQSTTPLWLRGMTYDRWDGRVWTRSAAATSSDLAPADPARPGWYTLGSSVDASAAPTWRIRVTDIDGRAQRTALWLLPGATRIHLDAKAGSFSVRRSVDGATNVPEMGGWLPGDQYETAGPYLGLDREGLETVRSDARVAPITTLAAQPPDAKAFRDAAMSVVSPPGTSAETSAGRRAERLEAWLRAAPFTHAVIDLRIDPRRPVSDFLFRARRGNCWCFASAMTLMMRSLGHPARLATGLRSGEWNRASSSYDFRGTDAHAWCEVWYQDRGWVIYDPTPAAPDAESSSTNPSADAGAAAGDGSGGGTGPSLWERIADYSPDDRARGLEWIGRTAKRVGAWIADLPLAVSIVAACLLVALVGVARHRRRPDATGVVRGTAASSPLRGPYARALSALAGAGVPRRSSETPGEFRRRASVTLPDVEAPLAVLTCDHDAERYGGSKPDDDTARRDVAASERILEIVARASRTTPAP